MSSGTEIPPNDRTSGRGNRQSRGNAGLPDDKKNTRRDNARGFFSSGPVWITAIAGLITAIGTFYGGTQVSAGNPASTVTVTETVTARAPGAAPGTEGHPASSPSSPAPATGNSTTYTASEPFAGCDQSGAVWQPTANLAPQDNCAQDMTVQTNNQGYAFNTVSSFPHGIPLSADSTVSVTGTIDGNYGDSCLGVAEGDATTGYAGMVCAGGEWYIKNVDGLGTTGASISSQVYTGGIVFTNGDSYTISLAFKAGTGTLTITSSTQGSAAPISKTFTTGQFTPTAVGFALGNDANTSSETVSRFRYTAAG